MHIEKETKFTDFLHFNLSLLDCFNKGNKGAYIQDSDYILGFVLKKSNIPPPPPKKNTLQAVFYA